LKSSVCINVIFIEMVVKSSRNHVGTLVNF
jgi:hypothetical protein